MGLLDNLMANPDNMALLGAAAGLLQAGAPSRLPVTMGQAMGQGLMGGMQGLGSAMQLTKQMQMLKMFNQLNGMNNPQSTPNVTGALQTGAQVPPADSTSQFMSGGTLPAGAGPTNFNAGLLNNPQFLQASNPQQQDAGSFMGHPASYWNNVGNIINSGSMFGFHLPAMESAYNAYIQNQNPSYGAPTPMMVNGKMQNVIINSKDGSGMVLPYGVKPNYKTIDQGGSTLMIDENNPNLNGISFGKGMTPAERITNDPLGAFGGGGGGGGISFPTLPNSNPNVATNAPQSGLNAGSNNPINPSVNPSSPVTPQAPFNATQTNPNQVKGTSSMVAPFGDGTPSGVNEGFLSTLNPQYAQMVRAVGLGQVQPPALGSRNPTDLKLMSDVMKYNPNFSGNTFQNRQSTINNFTTGNYGQTITAANTAIDHLMGLSNSYDQLNNKNSPWLNWAGNELGTVTGNQGVQQALSNVNMYTSGLPAELAKIYKGGQATDTEIADFRNNFSPNAAPAQQAGAIKSAVEMMFGKLSPLADQYNKAMNTNLSSVDFLSPQAKQNLINLSQKYNFQVPGLTNQTQSAPQATQSTLQFAPVNPQGWVLHKDAQGNMAYVNPANPKQYQEVK